MVLVEQILILLPPVFIILYVAINYYVKGEKSVCVLVLGDIGRSPRMQYHALSFVETGFDVDIVGYGGSEPQEKLRKSDSVTFHFLTEPPACLSYLPRLLVYMVKVAWQSVSLLSTLLLMPKCGYILMQNPPCIPALLMCLLTCVVRGSRLVIDWHNYGYTIMSMSMGPSNPLVRIARWYEKLFGRFSYKNICVTKAMQKDLQDNWRIQADVVYDRPPAMFRVTSIPDRHKLFKKLAEEYPAFRAKDSDTSNVFTTEEGSGAVRLRPDRPVLLVSSTSWTEDEDFSLLLCSLKLYEEEARSEPKTLPKIVCAITGKGPQKEYYREQISRGNWEHVSFCLPWLEPQDYPVLLGSADLGVCLHNSSSGLDLPMKVVDMFGCGLPVCAVNFNCLDELVKNNYNGLVFQDSAHLTQHIKTLVTGFPDSCSKLTTFRKNLSQFQATRWHDCWVKTVLPLFSDNDSESKKSR